MTLRVGANQLRFFMAMVRMMMIRRTGVPSKLCIVMGMVAMAVRVVIADHDLGLRRMKFCCVRAGGGKGVQQNSDAGREGGNKRQQSLSRANRHDSPDICVRGFGQDCGGWLGFLAVLPKDRSQVGHCRVNKDNLTGPNVARFDASLVLDLSSPGG